MSKILLILLYQLLIITVRSDYVGIRIFKSEDGCETPVKALVKIKHGANFSLNCKVVGAKFETLLPDKIVWGKKRGKLKFKGKYSWVMFMDNNITNDANLNFAYATMKDQGGYFCANPKHKLFKTVSIMLRSGSGRKIHHLKDPVFRRKRFVDNYADGTYNVKKGDFPDWLEILEQNKRDKEEKQKQQREKEERRKKEKEDAEMHRHMVAFGFAIGAAVVYIGITLYVVCLHMKARRDVHQNIQEAENRARETTQLDNTAVDTHTRDSNRRGVHFQSNGNGTDQIECPTALINSVPSDNANISNSNHSPNSNLYDINSSNSNNIDLPPSYEEAVVGLTRSKPPDTDSHMSAILE